MLRLRHYLYFTHARARTTGTREIRTETDPYELFAVGELLGPGHGLHEGLYSGSSHVLAKEEESKRERKRKSHTWRVRGREIEKERNSREKLVTSRE